MEVLKRKAIDILEWIVYKLFDTKQRRFITNLFTQKQKKKIKRLFSRGNIQTHLREIELTKFRLQNLGFTQRGLKDLRNIYQQSKDPFIKRKAAWELSLWHANQYNRENARRCLEMLSHAIEGETDSEQLRRVAIIEAECYELLGNIEAAKRTIMSALEQGPNADLYLAAANLESSASARIKWINKALQLYGISTVSLMTSTDRPLYDCLVCEREISEGVRLSEHETVKVTVIIPVYNAEDVIDTSLGSVLAQTWTNLEVFVVDDCSTDRTVSIVEEYVVRDKRVHLIKAKSNGGAYVARNLALREASGDFVTVNDADDWSHPEKIEKQVRHLLENPSVIGNTSQQARVTNELKFFRRGKPGAYIFSNMSSFMFRRKPVMEAVGYWDCVRFGADSEFIKRIKRVFGEEAVVEVPTGPLSFQRQSESSLTGNSAFGFPGYFMGARKEYAEAQNYFHSQNKNLRYEFPQQSRPFAVPEPMLPKRQGSGRRHFDVILASDFRLDGGSNVSNLEEIKAQKQVGLRTGLIQMSRYDYSPRKKINPKIRDLIDGDSVQMIVYGEKVSCDILLLRYPPILQEWQRFVPDVNAKDIRVIVNQTPMSDYGPNAVLRYDIRRASEHLQEYFGKEGVWHPIGPLIRKALHEHHAEELKSITLAKEDWSNIINVEEWKRPSRPKRGTSVRIGRHSRDQYVKWPSNREELLAIYPDSDEYEVHILGGAEIPRRVLGRLPSNWHVLEFGEMHPKDFLSTLDVFVYFTHPNWIEAFGRVIIEAMAAGVPVIVPYSYQELFREAAIYANPFEVKEKINQLMSDDDYYEAQVNRAYEYVEQHFGYSTHLSRLRKELINGREKEWDKKHAF